MNQTEKFFKCPFCFEKVSILIDTSVTAEHSYIEDCEVCCNPIQFRFFTDDGKVSQFRHEKAYD